MVKRFFFKRSIPFLAIGKVIDLNYVEDKTPSSGDLPRHVAKEFKQYCGPVWDKTTPFHVPISTFERRRRGGGFTRRKYL
jgi:hypothetical protein